MTTTVEEWPSSPKGYKIIARIGCGSLSTVYKGEVIEGKHKGEFVAIKKIELDKCTDTKIHEMRKSMLLANLLDHPNILRYKTTFITGQELWLVSEIMTGGSIDKIIQKSFPNGIKDQTLIATVLKETLKGLIYLHQNHQIHRDIQASSILVGCDGLVYISGFGVATKVKDGEKKNTCIGCPCWMAPEVLDQDEKCGYDSKADIWSLGITALELAHGQPPNSNLTTMQLIIKTLNDEPPKLKDEPCWDDNFREFVSYCLVKDPTKRKSAADLLKTCKNFFNKGKGPEYIKEKLLKGVESKNNEVPDVAPTESVSCNMRKSCTIQFDFSVEVKESESSETLDDLQIDLPHIHLTKKESEYILQQSLNNNVIQTFGSSKIKDQSQFKKLSCSAASRMLHVEKSEKLLLSKGDYEAEFSFLNEEEI